MLSLALLLFSFAAPQDKPAPPVPPAQAPADAAWKVSVPAFPNATCPIMGKPISVKLYTDTPRGRIYICCKACIKDIQADVEMAYKAAFPKQEKLANKVCPVTEKPITPESPRVEIQGFEFSVHDEAAAKRVADDLQAVLAKLHDPSLVDVGNRTCPVTGEAAKNHVVVVAKQLIRLSTPKAVETVQQEPQRIVEKARQIRAAQDAEAAKQPAPKPAEGGDGKKA